MIISLKRKQAIKINKTKKKHPHTLNLRVAKLIDIETNTEKIIRPFTDSGVLCK